jgi:FkbM family methyltransferase
MLNSVSLLGRIFGLTRHCWPNDRFLWPTAQIITRMSGIAQGYSEYVTVHGFQMGLDPLEYPDGAMVYGTFEVATVRLLQHLLRAGDVVADVGANIGYHTLIMARLVGPSGKVYAFEPNPLSRTRLEANLSANNFSNVQVFGMALSDREGEASIFEAPASHGEASLRPRGEDWQSTACRTARLDVALAEVECLNLIKIDVEGAETLVLRGAMETLHRLRPHIILEKNYEALATFGSDFAEIERILAGSHQPRKIETNRGFANFYFAPLHGLAANAR